MSIRTFTQIGLQEILRFAFPPKCPGCGKDDIFLCAACQANLAPAVKHVSEAITAIFPYREPRVKRMLWLLKYRGKTAVADVFARYLLNAIRETETYTHETNLCIVPMPMSKKNLKRRGWNHAGLIAKSLADMLGENAHFDGDALSKIKETRRQATIKKRSARLLNLKHSMHAQHVAGKTIILVDDVTTTGASIGEAMRALKDAGARDVQAFVIAH